MGGERDRRSSAATVLGVTLLDAASLSVKIETDVATGRIPSVWVVIGAQAVGMCGGGILEEVHVGADTSRIHTLATCRDSKLRTSHMCSINEGSDVTYDAWRPPVRFTA